MHHECAVPAGDVLRCDDFGPAGGGPPAGESQAIKLVAQVKEDAEKDIRLNWVNHMALYGEYLFVSAHRDGRVNVFKPDPSAATPRFCGFVDLAVELKSPHKHLDAFPVLSARTFSTSAACGRTPAATATAWA